jgi:hypothetical protein
MVCENGMLRRSFVPVRDEVGTDCRKLHLEGFRNLYFLQNVIRILSEGVKWSGRVGDEKTTQKFGSKTWREDITGKIQA